MRGTPILLLLALGCDGGQGTIDAATPDATADASDSGVTTTTQTVTYKITVQGTTSTASTSIDGETAPSAGGSGVSTVADGYGSVMYSDGAPLGPNQYARVKSVVAAGTFGDISGTPLGTSAPLRNFAIYLGNWTTAGPTKASSGPSSGAFPKGAAGAGHDGGVLVSVSSKLATGASVSATGATATPPATTAEYTWPSGYLLTPESTLWVANRGSTSDSCTFTITMDIVTFTAGSGISTDWYEMGTGGYGTIDGTDHVDPVYTVPAGHQAYVVTANTNVQTCGQTVAGVAYGDIVYGAQSTLLCGVPLDKASWNGGCGPEYTNVYGRQNNNATQQYALDSTAPNNAWLKFQNNTTQPMDQSSGLVVLQGNDELALKYKMFTGDNFIWRVSLLVVPDGYVP